MTTKRYYCNITVLMDAGPKDDPKLLLEKLVSEAALDLEDVIEITKIDEEEQLQEAYDYAIRRMEPGLGATR